MSGSAQRIADLLAAKEVYGEGRAFELAESWREALRLPGILEDLLVLGQFFELPVAADGGPLSEAELREQAARRGLVMRLLARGEITHDELNTIRTKETQDGGFDIEGNGAGDEIDF